MLVLLIACYTILHAVVTFKPGRIKIMQSHSLQHPHEVSVFNNRIGFHRMPAPSGNEVVVICTGK